MADEELAASLEQRGTRRARKAGLYYVNSFDRGMSRRRCGRGFTYLSSRGRTITSARTRKRIEALAIPPAWTDVWICPKPNGHIQATGRDEAGRKQYIYHPDWQAISAASKYDRLSLLARLLPRIRRRVRKELNRKRLARKRVLATVVRLIDRAHIRVGSRTYTEKHDSRGATTLTDEHVETDGLTISLEYPSKGGREREIEISDRKAAKVIRRCEEIDSQFLFCYRDTDGEHRPVDSTDVNAYLREVAKESVTAKDFRTWWGSVIALASLARGSAERRSAAERKRAVQQAIAETADALGNTKAVCRDSYIHPAILAAGESGELAALIEKADAAAGGERLAELTNDETRFASILPLLDR